MSMLGTPPDEIRRRAAALLRERGPMTTGELAAATGVPSWGLGGALMTAVKRGTMRVTHHYRVLTWAVVDDSQADRPTPFVFPS